ncbi:unnamed protein product [Durusdinium trenchii]|uniref:Uncharacterized protein n=1 Tax=Durusdinium trenchii TaxID=1381693 RepID=A0ABP0SRZ6_9DINO
MQPTLMHQPSANLTILTNEDSQKNTSIYRKESLALDDLLSEREDPAMELLGRLSELFKKQEVQIQTLNDEVQRLQGRIRRISLENADLKSNPTTPQAYKPEELPENFLQLKIMRGPSRGPPEHEDEVPDEHTEQSREMPPSSGSLRLKFFRRAGAKGEEIFSQGNDAGQLCALPENFWEDDEDPRTEKGEDRVVDGVSYNVLHLEKYCWPFWILEPASSSDPYYIL